ncbi:MAG: hypothetical protein U0930_05065 [Pirellulales bacterium]
MKSLTIGLDYDDTFTADFVLWAGFIRQAILLGHRVLMVTARRETEENVDQINSHLDQYQCQIPIYFTSLRSKIDYMKERGINVDIWIENDPVTLVRGH